MLKFTEPFVKPNPRSCNFAEKDIGDENATRGIPRRIQKWNEMAFRQQL